MKTYLVTEKDIERLRYNLDCNGYQNWWYMSQLDNWEETLKLHSSLDLEVFDKQVDEILENTTKEEMQSWLQNKREKEKNERNVI